MRRLDSGPGVTPVVSEPKQDAEDRVEVMRGLNPLLQSDLEGNDQQEGPGAGPEELWLLKRQ